MNCKQGDLAMIVYSKCSPELIGSIVRCVRFEPGPTGKPAWRIDRKLHSGKQVRPGLTVEGDWWEDSTLRPIRDQPGEDETLTWAPVPSTVEL